MQLKRFSRRWNGIYSPKYRDTGGVLHLRRPVLASSTTVNNLHDWWIHFYFCWEFIPDGVDKISDCLAGQAAGAEYWVYVIWITVQVNNLFSAGSWPLTWHEWQDLFSYIEQELKYCLPERIVNFSTTMANEDPNSTAQHMLGYMFLGTAISFM